MASTNPDVETGVELFNRYLGIVDALNRPGVKTGLIPTNNLETYLDQGYRTLRGILELCGASVSYFPKNNTLVLPESCLSFVVLVNRAAYGPDQITELPQIIADLRPNPLLTGDAASRFGRPGGFLFAYLMDGIPVGAQYKEPTEAIDASRKLVRRSGTSHLRAQRPTA